MTDDELMDAIEALRNLMAAVATGAPRIQEVEAEYVTARREIRKELDKRGLVGPNPHKQLWNWYGKWSGGDLPSYQSRREYLSELFAPLLERIESKVSVGSEEVFDESIGWARTDRALTHMRELLEQAETEEEYQAIGLFCRELLVSLAQEVYDPLRHPSTDASTPIKTDAKRMLASYIAVQLSGSHSESLRKLARAAVDHANEVQHRRTADFGQAAICAQATSAVINIVAILEGRRDPARGPTARGVAPQG
jgi:hypothetical protein